MMIQNWVGAWECAGREIRLCNEEGDKIAMRRRFLFGGSVPWHDLIMDGDTDKDVQIGVLPVKDLI